MLDMTKSKLEKKKKIELALEKNIIVDKNPLEKKNNQKFVKLLKR